MNVSFTSFLIRRLDYGDSHRKRDSQGYEATENNRCRSCRNAQLTPPIGVRYAFARQYRCETSCLDFGTAWLRFLQCFVWQKGMKFRFPRSLPFCRPNAELRATQGFNTIPDRYDNIKIVIICRFGKSQSPVIHRFPYLCVFYFSLYISTFYFLL